MKKEGLILIAVLMLVSSLAEGANWVKLGSDEKQVDYFDADTISRNGNIVKFWNKLEYVKDTKYKYFISYIELDCSDKKFRLLQETAYLLNGQIVDNPHKKTWQNIIPGSGGESFLVMCKK